MYLLRRTLNRIFAPRFLAVESQGAVTFLHLSPLAQAVTLTIVLGISLLSAGALWFGAVAKERVAGLEEALVLSQRTHDSFLVQLDDDMKNLISLRSLLEEQRQSLIRLRERERSLLEAVSALAMQAPPGEDSVDWAISQLEAQRKLIKDMEHQLNSVANSFSALLEVAPPTEPNEIVLWLAERLSAVENTFEGQRSVLEHARKLVKESLTRAEANLAVLPKALLGPGGLGLEGVGGEHSEVGGSTYISMSNELEALKGLSERFERVRTLELCAPLTTPVDYYNLSSQFGSRKDPFNGSPDWHEGVDLAAWPGTKVRATAAGDVVFAGPRSGYGNMVLIDHGCGLQTLYGHLESVSVLLGQTVKFRDEIGVVGTSGRSTGPHVHYEIRHGSEPLDPQKFIEAGRYVSKGEEFSGF